MAERGTTHSGNGPSRKTARPRTTAAELYKCASNAGTSVFSRTAFSLSLDAWKALTASSLASPSNTSAPLAKARRPSSDFDAAYLAINQDARGSGCRRIRRLGQGRVGSQAPRVGQKFQQRVPVISLRRPARADPSPQWLCSEHRRIRGQNRATTDPWNGRTAT